MHAYRTCRAMTGEICRCSDRIQPHHSGFGARQMIKWKSITAVASSLCELAVLCSAILGQDRNTTGQKAPGARITAR